MADYLNKYDTTAQYTAESSDRAALGETVSLVTLDGKVYYDHSTTKIGDKVYNVVKMPDGKRWLAQNLDWLPEGITLVTSSSQAPSTPAACYYGYTDNGKGLLYNGYALETINQLVPAGWRIPHKSDYDGLFTAIGGNTVANIKKIRSTSGWPSIQGTDNYGLNIYPNGHRSSPMTFLNPTYSYLWTDTLNDGNIYRVKIEQETNADIISFGKSVYYSVRPVKD